MTAKRPPAPEPNAAVRAEPATVGTARARDRLALEVRLLGSLLGQVIAEQAGPDLLDLVERIRRSPFPQPSAADSAPTLVSWP